MSDPDPQKKPEQLFQATAEGSRLSPTARLAIGLLVGGVVLVGLIYVARRFQESPAPDTSASAEQPLPDAPPEPGPELSEGAMVRVEGGTFQMGSTQGDADEKPVTEQRVATFEIDTTEVTVNAYRACVDAGKCNAPDTGTYCNWGRDGYDHHPINCIDWTQASSYCAFVGKRLPTEAEWAYAARGSDGRIYPWKEGPPSNQLCWNGEGNDRGKNNRQGTCAVGRFPSGASPFGALDMAGNVWEWTASAYCPYGGGECSDERRVIRGGGWNNVVPEFVRAQDRSKEPPSARNDNIGFRCARSPK